MVVYKYQKIDEWFYKNLINMQIYCNSPENFNDPFDCQTELSYTESLGKIIEEKRNHQDLMEKMLTGGPVLMIKHLVESELRDNFFVKDMITSLKSGREKLYISCFSDSLVNELLWAHYGWNHKGICIAYDIPEIKKVKYSEDYPRLSDDFIEKLLMLRREGIEAYPKYKEELQREFSEKAILTKSKAWEYENEWRLINNEEFVNINKNQFKSIYFGLRTSEEDKKAILQILKDKDIKIPVYQMEKVKGKFLFEPKLINE